MLFFGFLMALSEDDTGYAKVMLDAIRANHVIYTQGTVLEIARERISDYVQLMRDSVFYFPQVMLLFIAGIFAVRMGWLTRPERHRELWGRVMRVALMIGLPLNLGFAIFTLLLTSDPIRHQAADYFFRAVMEIAGPLLAAGYVAAFLRARATVHAWAQFLLAPVGRMALTNYLSQSVLCVLILQGAGLGMGLGLGKSATPTFLLAVALSIMVLQLSFSRWWLARNDQGPLEALWRRFTYGSVS